MTRQFQIVLTLILTVILIGCKSFDNRNNPLYGRIFRDINEIPELNNYTDIGGSVINSSKDKNGNYRFGIGQYQSHENSICILEEFLESDEKGKVKYKILDTINIGKIKETEYLTYCNCRQDTTLDSEIIALVVADQDKEFYDKVVKAWRADTKTGKIKRIKNLKGINCINEGYGYEEIGKDLLK